MVGEQFTDCARTRQSVRAAVDEPEPRMHFAVTVEKGLAENLEPGAHGEDDGPAIVGA